MEVIGLVENWRTLVEHVAAGYSDSLCVDDYFQDLATTRDRLEKVLAEVGRSMSEPALLESVLRSDLVFAAATRPLLYTRLSGERWWHWRAPVLHGTEFEEELTSNGLV